MSAEENFRAALHAAGLDYAGPIPADGKLHRIKIEGDKERNSWFVLHVGPPAAGAFGCWKRGVKETWCERNGQLSQEEWNRVREQWKEAEREREQSEQARHAKARRLAAWILSRSRPARTLHRYLSSKGVKVFGDLREWRDALVLPLRDDHGDLHGLQFIREDGSKRFLKGGRIAGCSFIVAEKPDGPLVACEGYATGASIHEATGLAVVCAMHAGNLKAVVETLRKLHPNREIIIAADNDTFTMVNGQPKNPGLDAAMEAARCINAKLAAPQFQDVSTKPTDFNDLHRLAGLSEVARQIQATTIPSPAPDIHSAPRKISKPLITLPPEDQADAADTPQPFPVECLPPDIALMVRGVALALRVPDSLPGVMALALVSASIGKGLVLDWRPGKAPTPANLFFLLSADSGTGKSECYKMVAQPFLAFERAMQEYWRKEVQSKLQADLRYHEGQLKKLDRKLAKDSTTEQEAERCRAEQKYHLAQKSELEAKLHEPQLSIQDATVEKAATVMHHNDETIFSTSSDARKLVDNLLGRYSANKRLADDGIYLNAFSGDDVKVDRQGREGVRLANPCLTLLWALQPDALNMLLDEQSLQQGGFLARCLPAHTWAEPQHIGGESRGLSDETRARWETLIHNLLATYRQPRSLPAGVTETAKATHTVQATPEARQCLESYFNEIVDRRRAGELTDVSQYASRWCEQAARIALALHAGLHGAHAHQHPLELETAENAVRFAKWFADQQLGLLAKGRHAAASKQEDEVLELIESNRQRKGQDFITARDVHRARITATADAAKALLARMEADGLLVGEDITPQHGGKTTRVYRAARNPVPG